MPSEVTLLRRRWREGDGDALHELMPLVYRELHRIAEGVLRRQGAGHTLQPTGLVNEAYVKLFDSGEPKFEDRAHFLAVMARAMRQVLIDYGRASAAAKRGGREQKIALDSAMLIGQSTRPGQLQMWTWIAR